MIIKAFFNLIRWKNLLLIACMQVLIKFFFLNTQHLTTQHSNYLFFLLVTTTVLLTASGYIINNIVDVNTDQINKPTKVVVGKQISKKNAKKTYKLLTSIGLIIGFFISFKIKKPMYSFIFIGISVLLYFYAIRFKGKMLVGNIIVSFLLASSIYILIIFDVNIPYKKNVQFVIFTYAFLAFILNLIREIIKDIEDINGDYRTHLKTLPIVLGRKFSKNIALCLSLFTIFFFLYGFSKLPNPKLPFFYTFSTIFLPFLYFTYKLWNAKNNKQYTLLSKLLKLIILFGVLSIPILSNHL